jgi:mannose-6-phosphate isomerase-like protein (cupin superfamily)
MSFQRHFKRNEIWLVSEGSCVVSYFNETSNKNISEIQLNKFDHYLVPVEHWHQINNVSESKTHIIEIQYGDDCIESDIERLNKI